MILLRHSWQKKRNKMKTLKRKILSYFKMYSEEDLSNNFIDKDVQSMLFPLNLMQIVSSFCPKYRIRNNFISSNSLLSTFVSFCASIIFIALLFYSLVYKHIGEHNDIEWDLSIPRYITSKIDFVLFTFGIISNFLRSFLHTKQNVIFVLKFQEINRCINTNISLKYFIIGNWFTFILFFTMICTVGIFFGLITKITFTTFTNTLILSNFDINIIYVTRLIQLLKVKVDLWNIQVLQYQGMEDRDREDHCKRMFRAYGNVLLCYEILKNSFQQMVSSNFLRISRTCMTVGIYVFSYSISILFKLISLRDPRQLNLLSGTSQASLPRHFSGGRYY